MYLLIYRSIDSLLFLLTRLAGTGVLLPASESIISTSIGVLGLSPSSLNGRRKAIVMERGDNGVAFAPVAGNPADSPSNQGSSERASIGDTAIRRGVGTGGGDRRG